MKVKIIPKKLRGTIVAIPSKSHAHRVLIAQKLAQIQGAENAENEKISTFSEDIKATKICLYALEKSSTIFNCGESGSTLRFLLPVAMALKDKAHFTGAGKLPQRPISPLKEEMERHGCSFLIHSNSEDEDCSENRPICTVTGRLTPGKYILPGNISSQFITGLLFALPLLKGDSLIELTTELESAGYVNLTMQVLSDFGIIIRENTSPDGFKIYKIPGNQKYIKPSELSIEGDWSNASVWLVCGALGGDITCTGLDMDSGQRDKEIANILKNMGAEITTNDTGITCRGSNLHGTDVGVSQFPDLVPVMAAAMASATGDSQIRDGQRLRIKESDRIATVCDILSRTGADISETEDGLIIKGKKILDGGTVDSHNDHRIVMAAAAASCSCKQPVIIETAEAIKKSYPDFFKDFSALGGEVHFL